MKPIIYIFILVFLGGLISSCESSTYPSDEDCIDYDYSDCNTIEPDEGYLTIKLTINKQNTHVPVTVYLGDIENNNIIEYDTIDQPYYQVPVALNQTYSASAKYMDGDKIIIAVDGDKIRKTSSIVCDSTCWKIKGGDIDIRLKYDN